MPTRHLRGLLPESLLQQYIFWQKRDLSMLARRPEAGVPGVAPAGSLVLDELSITLDKRGAVVRRVPLTPQGQPIKDQVGWRCFAWMLP